MLLRESEHTGRSNAGRLGTHPHTDQTPADRHTVEGLLERRLKADRVERHIEHPPARDIGDLVSEPFVAGIECVIGAEFDGAIEDLGLDVDRDHRHGADQPRELHDVRADSADAPYADRFADADLARAHHGSERRRHRIGEDRRLLHRDVVGDAGQADRLRDGVFRPCPVVGERHQLDPQAVRDVAAAAVRAGGARSARGDDHAITFGPAGDVGAEPGDGSRRFVALGHHGALRRKCAVDQAEVGMTDAAVCDLHEHFAGCWLGNRNIFYGNGFGFCVEPFSSHGVNHFAPFAPAATIG